MTALELGLAVVDPRRLADLDGLARVDGAALAAWVDAPELAPLVPAGALATHLYFGSEFCEHLFPDDDALRHAAALATKFDLTLVLATPVANDALVARILAAVADLPARAEVLVNDWGVAHAVRAAAPTRRLVAGRQLAKMIKDPRVPSPAWMKPYPSSYGARGYREVLAKLGMERIELDVPPFATAATYAVAGLAVSVWAPFAYVAKGRICKIGSLQRERAEKFAPAGSCHRECLGIVEVGTEPSAAGIVSYGRGNSIYYRHDAGMTAVLRDALAAGHVDRVVFSGI